MPKLAFLDILQHGQWSMQLSFACAPLSALSVNSLTANLAYAAGLSTAKQKSHKKKKREIDKSDIATTSEAGPAGVVDTK